MINKWTTYLYLHLNSVPEKKNSNCSLIYLLNNFDILKIDLYLYDKGHRANGRVLCACLRVRVMRQKEKGMYERENPYDSEESLYDSSEG